MKVTMEEDEEANRVIDYQDGDDLNEIVGSHLFTILCFYNEDEWGAGIAELMDGAKTYFDQQIEGGHWTERDVGWIRVDMTKNPDYAT